MDLWPVPTLHFGYRCCSDSAGQSSAQNGFLSPAWLLSSGTTFNLNTQEAKTGRSLS